MIALDQGGRALTGGAVVSPPPALIPWVVEGWIDRVSGSAWKIVADDAPHLIYSETERSGGRRERRLMLVGARSRAVELNRCARRLTVALRLRAGSVPTIFGLAGHEIVDRSVAFAELPSAVRRWGDDGSLLLDRLAGVEAEESLSVLFDWVVGRVQSTGAAKPDWRIRALPNPREGGSFAAGPVRRVCRDHGVSPRSLRQVFRDGVGLAPSTVFRIRRLHAALIRGLHGPERWSRVAHRCGYADQSHLIRDCRDLLGETPDTFRNRAAEAQQRNSSVPIRSIGGRPAS